MGDGRELALVRPADGKPIVKRRRTDGWTAAKRVQFLDGLASTCNVSEAVAPTGMALSGAYTLRRRDPVFRAEWADALECGYARLETMLLARAAGTDAPTGAPTHAPTGASRRAGVEMATDAPDAPAFDAGAHPERTGELDTQLALSLLRLHRTTIGGGTRGGGRPVTKVDPDELAESILTRLAALNGRRGGRG